MAGAGRAGWTVVPSLAPAGPLLGRFIPFLRRFPKVSPWLTLPAFPFTRVRALVRDSERNITKGSSGAKAIPNPVSVSPSCWIPLVPIALGIRGLLLPYPSALGLQVSGTEGKGSSRLALPHEDLKPLCPSSCRVSWSLLPPRAGPWQGLVSKRAWI